MTNHTRAIQVTVISDNNGSNNCSNNNNNSNIDTNNNVNRGILVTSFLFIENQVPGRGSQP